MEIFLPTLEAKITSLVVTFRFIVFAIMVIGLIAHMASDRAQGVNVLRPLVTAVILVTIIASLDQWYPKLDQGALAVADYINPGYTTSPTAASDTIRESTTANPQGQSWSWRKLNESIYQAVTNAIANVFIYLGTLLTVPMLILQYVLRWFLYLLAPFALAVFLLPGGTSIGVRFFQQVLAIHAWPIGFAVTNLVALAVWNDFRNAVGANPGNVADALYSPLLSCMGGLLATIVIFVGMISTPIVMQKLFVSGYAFSGTSGNPMTYIRVGQETARMVALTKMGGPAVAAGAASAASRSLPSIAAENRPGI